MLEPPHPRRPSAPRPDPVDAAFVIQRLEEAGATLLALPDARWTEGLSTSLVQIMRTALEVYGWNSAMARRAIIPSCDKIARMEEAIGWIGLIPPGRSILQRIVGVRSLVHPVTNRHLFHWRRVLGTLGAGQKTVQRWHAQGIDLIVEALNAARA